MIHTMFLLAISLSIDALGLGVSYGIKGVKMPLMPKMLICFSSVLYAVIGLTIGSWLLILSGAEAGNIIGILILLLMGTWMILKSRKSNNIKVNNTKHFEEQGKLLEFAIKSIGITIMVVKNPTKGDIDNSGIIDLKEALLLGIALNLDATAACMGIIMIGVSSLFIPLFVGAVQMFFLEGGVLIGRTIVNKKFLNEKLISIIPGLILIALGLARIAN